MNIAFWDNNLCERGTTVSLFDYAYYNQSYLKNKSFVFYDKKRVETKPHVVAHFKKHFVVHETNGFDEVDQFIRKYKINIIYIIKAGGRDNRFSRIAKNCIHCVFSCSEPHGDIYSAIAPWVNANNGRFPVVPHMINLPRHEQNLREQLKIPDNAVVFGGYGGEDNFDIKFVHEVVFRIAQNFPNIYFLFANFKRFCPVKSNIIHLPTITDLDEKTTFINTTDAMLWARSGGEVMSIAMGEFSTLNKPIICTKTGGNGHVLLLKEQAIWYTNKSDLFDILTTFDPIVERTKDWNAYKEYTPEKVMDIFNKTFIQPFVTH
jgi:hypothetical protein